MNIAESLFQRQLGKRIPRRDLRKFNQSHNAKIFTDYIKLLPNYDEMVAGGYNFWIRFFNNEEELHFCTPSDDSNGIAIVLNTGQVFLNGPMFNEKHRLAVPITNSEFGCLVNKNCSFYFLLNFGECEIIQSAVNSTSLLQISDFLQHFLFIRDS
jgi:hypothetical protein